MSNIALTPHNNKRTSDIFGVHLFDTDDTTGRQNQGIIPTPRSDILYVICIIYAFLFCMIKNINVFGDLNFDQLL